MQHLQKDALWHFKEQAALDTAMKNRPAKAIIQFAPTAAPSPSVHEPLPPLVIKEDDKYNL